MRHVCIRLQVGLSAWLLACGPPAVAPAMEVALPPRPRPIAAGPLPETPREAPPAPRPANDVPAPVAWPWRPSPPLVEPDLDPLRAALRRAYPGLRRCYVRALQREPALAGGLTADLDVEDDGRVRVKVASATLPTPLSECVATTLGALRVPAGAGGVHLQVPLRFSPN